MNQLFKITINGIDVTLRVSGTNISEEMNRIYDVATFQISEETEILIDKEVVINYGDKTFTGFVYSRSKTGKNTYRVECRTYSAKLTEPYSPAEIVTDSATTSHDLCALYANESGIPIAITSVNLDFGGSYERNGTMLSALLNIASVTGAEYYNDVDTVRIAPNKAIDGNGIEIPKGDIFNFVATRTGVYNKGIGYVVIQNGGIASNDIISVNKIYAEIDECSGEIFVFPNPNGLIEHSVGISELTPITLQRREERDMLDIDIVRLDGAIAGVVEVLLNGTPITNYNFEQNHNVIYFEAIMRGTLEIVYNAYSYKGYANIKVTPLGRFISLDLYYLDQALLFQGFLSEDCSNIATDGDMSCIVPSEMHYNAGFDVWTIGGVPIFTFYNKNLEIIRDVVSTPENYTSVESVTLEEVVAGYRYQTRFPITVALGARSAGVDIPYTTSFDGDSYYFEFTEFAPRVEVSYETSAIRHYVQFPTIDDGVIIMVIRNENTDQLCEYDISSMIECGLDQFVPIDVASELGLEVSDIKGTTIQYTTPTGSGSAIIDDFGVIEIWVFIDGDYVLDTLPLKPRTSITLTSNVAGI